MMVTKDEKKTLNSVKDSILQGKEGFDKKLAKKIAKKHYKLYEKLAE